MTTKRRTFLKQTGIAATAISLYPATAWPFTPLTYNNIDQILEKLSVINDNRVETLLTRQINEKDSRWDGGLTDGYGIPNAHSTTSFITTLSNAYASPFSQYHLSAELLTALEKAMACLLKVQYEDGTIDLHTTNFHSTPDTAFIVNYLSPVYVVLKNMEQPTLKNLITDMAAFLRNTDKCLSVGGIHTPNHRWVVCSALARIHSFFPDPKYVQRIDEWLSEGIDQDPDGQYNEQSVSIYSPTCNDMFLTMGRLLDRPELLEVVRKNLEMSLYYIQPGGEVLTDASGRQDSARTGYVNGYYYTYRYFAIKDQNPAFAAVCQLIETQMPQRITRFIPYLMEEPVFQQPLPSPTQIPDNYFKRFAHSGVFRIRRGNTDISIIEENPTFLTFIKGKAVLQSIRLHAAYYGPRGQFKAENAAVEGEKITLSRSDTHGYFQPLPKDKIPVDGDWEKMPREERRMRRPQTIDYKITIQESKGKITMDIVVEGVDHIPVSMELSFRKGGTLTGITTDQRAADVFFLEEGTGTYQVENDTIHFGPGLALHQWAQMRGMLPKQAGNSVYLTGYTPFRHRLELW